MAGVSAYATPEQLVSLFGEDEMLTLAVGVDGELDEARITAAIEWASSEADSFLSARYAVPVEPVPPVLTTVVGDIARYRLTGHNTVENEVILRRYEKAIEWLKAIAEGMADLPGQDDSETDDGEWIGTGGASIKPGTRDWP